MSNHEISKSGCDTENPVFHCIFFAALPPVRGGWGIEPSNSLPGDDLIKSLLTNAWE